MAQVKKLRRRRMLPWLTHETMPKVDVSLNLLMFYNALLAMATRMWNAEIWCSRWKPAYKANKKNELQQI
jgi:hypothetical protein